MVLFKDGKAVGGSGTGGFDRATERCAECDGHWRHEAFCRWEDLGQLKGTACVQCGTGCSDELNEYCDGCNAEARGER